MPTRPSVAPAALSADAAKSAKKAKEEIEAAKIEKERTELIRKINGYVDSPLFKRTIAAELDLKPFKGHESLAVARETYARIKALQGTVFKRTAVNKLFDMSGMAIGMIGARMFAFDHFAAFPRALDENRDVFAEELEEIAIEMSNDWVPGPMPRLAFKMLAFAQEFHKTHGDLTPNGKAEEELLRDRGLNKSAPSAGTSFEEDEDSD